MLAALSVVQSAAQANSFDCLLEASSLIAEEIIEAQVGTTDQHEQLLLQYLQFEVSIYPIKAAIGRGRFDFAFDWIHNGLSDKVVSNAEREFFLERPWRFIGALVDELPTSFPNSFLKWAELFFYYCRHQSALQTQANSIAQLVEGTVFRLPASLDLAVNAAVSLMIWGQDVGNETAPRTATVLRGLFDSSGVSRASKASIAKAFSTRCCNLIGESHFDWADILMQDYSDFLAFHAPFQFLYSTFNSVDDWDRNTSELINSATEYSRFMRKKFPEYTDWIIALDQKSYLLSPIAKMAIDYERSSDFCKVIAAWYGGEIETAAAGTNALLPTAISGVGFLVTCH